MKENVKRNLVKGDCSKILKGEFEKRHIGCDRATQKEMLKFLGFDSLDKLIDSTIPESIRLKKKLDLPHMASESALLQRARGIAQKNQLFRSYIGMGYYNTLTPAVIQRVILENPGWYTQYTPYQAEISQGRLEMLLNFQTMVADLCGLDLANASLLDEGTAAAEAMSCCYRISGSAENNLFVVSDKLFPQTLDIVKLRAQAVGIEVVELDLFSEAIPRNVFGVLAAYPDATGEIKSLKSLADKVHESNATFACVADLLALTLFTPPGEFGADIVVGSTQRFGVPLGFGGPHAAFFATKEEFKRFIPGRIVGVSKDTKGRKAYRLAIQVREQHIKREKATSNICTAQVLLAIIAAAYAIYHGPDGLRNIALRVNRYARALSNALKKVGVKVRTTKFFDTMDIVLSGPEFGSVKSKAESLKINFRYFVESKPKEEQLSSLGVSLDETVTVSDLKDIFSCFSTKIDVLEDELAGISSEFDKNIPLECRRASEFLGDSVFRQYQTETELLRYLKRLEAKDLSLTSSMIPLGSCTMKLNAAVEMMPVTWPEFSGLHPFVPREQAEGYHVLISELQEMLAEVTGFSAVSLQPNAGSQGEFSGLLAIREFYRSKGEEKRNICLIPQSAHGTNPASSVMAGMEVVRVKCDDKGNVDLDSLRSLAEEYSESLAALMITYPSTHGVFEEGIVELCEIVHSKGGQVYLDGANLNALVGLSRPGDFGADVCHVNLHKTFCIPHGGGGPGVGPIAVASHLAPFLPAHRYDPWLDTKQTGGAVGAVSAAPYGSANVLVISWAYMHLMGGEGLLNATKAAILNANYIAGRLSSTFPILYRGANGQIAHECILDMRSLKRSLGVTVEDVAKRLMDFSFHAPTVSFPVAETLMVEPTESESKAELDRFCDAMLAIGKELEEIADGQVSKTDNVLKGAPHTIEDLINEDWDHSYSREKAAFPVNSLRAFKFWPPVSRIDNAYGDRNLICNCG